MSSGASEWASERMSAAKRASEASNVEQVNEWAVRVNERAYERMAQYRVIHKKVLHKSKEKNAQKNEDDLAEQNIE